MNKLTAGRCKQRITELQFKRDNQGMSNQMYDYLEALEIALPMLEQQEVKKDVSLREGIARLSSHIDQIGGYNFEALRAEQDDSDWISCSERMPETPYEQDQFIVYTDSMIVMAAWFNRVHGIFKDEHNGCVIDDVTHWQPLPAPPQPQPSTNPQIDNDGWIEWKGGEMPLDAGIAIEFELRDGERDRTVSDYLDWAHVSRSDDIIAYRVIQEQPTNQNGEQ